MSDYEQKEFQGKAGSSTKVRLGMSSSVKSIALVGLGKKSAFKSARAVSEDNDEGGTPRCHL